jgi:hypothetical protein
MTIRIETRHDLMAAGGTNSADDEPLLHGEEPPLAAHLITPRMLYEHHGIYVGFGTVIHYAGMANRRWAGPIEEIPLEAFAQGHPVRVRRDSRLFDSAEAVLRARSRLGERRYGILHNNCEHFCSWVLRDESRSDQIDELRGIPRRASQALLDALSRILNLRPVSPSGG